MTRRAPCSLASAGCRRRTSRAGEDRYYGRILIIMVVVLILSGFVLGIIANLITGGG